MKVLATPRSFGKNNPELFDILRDAGLDVVRNDTGGILSADRMCEKLADCDGLIVGVDPVDATVLAAAPRLRAIAKYGVGLDNIDLAACEARGIKVSRTVGANSEAVADYALALMLGVARKVALIDRRCRERDWSKITGIDLYGKTVGIIGLGAIGKRVARRCGAGFGMKVLGHDIVWDDAWASENHVERADLERIFREADFISLHTSLDDSTRHLVDAPRLALMKPTAILINTARGELVDGPALLEALEQKRIYGAGLDVFEQEPPQDARWYALDNLVMGSHCSSSTSGAVATMGHMAVSNLLRDLGLKSALAFRGMMRGGGGGGGGGGPLPLSCSPPPRKNFCSGRYGRSPSLTGRPLAYRRSGHMEHKAYGVPAIIRPASGESVFHQRLADKAPLPPGIEAITKLKISRVAP